MVEGETERDNLVRTERQKHLNEIADNLEKWQLAAKNYLHFLEPPEVREARRRGPCHKYKEEIKTLKRTLKDMQSKLQYAEFHLAEKRAHVRNTAINDVELELSEEKKTTADLQKKNIQLRQSLNDLETNVKITSGELEVANRKLEKAQVVINSMQANHKTELQNAHLKGILVGKDSAGSLATLQELCEQPIPHRSSPLEDSFGSGDLSFTPSNSM